MLEKLLAGIWLQTTLTNLTHYLLLDRKHSNLHCNSIYNPVFVVFPAPCSHIPPQNFTTYLLLHTLFPCLWPLKFHSKNTGPNKKEERNIPIHTCDKFQIPRGVLTCSNNSMASSMRPSLTAASPRVRRALCRLYCMSSFFGDKDQ